MAKFTPQNISSGFQSTEALNNNFDQLETLSDTFLSRDGTSPNTMLANLDMNSQRIINLPAPAGDNDPARWTDVVNALDLTGVAVPSMTGNAGKFLGTTGSNLVWQSVNNIKSVLEYGAVGDGVTNDTTSLQTALNAGGVLLFPAGYTFLTDALNVISNTTIIIQGTVKSRTANVDVFTNSAAITNVTLLGQGGIIDGNRSAHTSGFSRGIYFYHASGVSNIRIEGLKVQECYTDGIAVYNGTDIIIRNNRINNITANGIKAEAFTANATRYLITENIISNTTSQNGIFTYADTGYTFTNSTISNNIVYNAGDTSIEVGLRSSGITVSDNILDTATAAVLFLRGCTLVTASGNICRNGDVGILASTIPGDPAASSIIITGNYCYDNSASAISAGIKTSIIDNVTVTGNSCYSNNIGIYAVQTNNGIFNNNTSYTNELDGISVEDCQYCQIKSNICFNNYQDNGASTSISGIRLTASGTLGLYSRYLDCTDNKCYDTQGTKTQVNGIAIHNTTQSTVSRNTIHSNKTNAYSATGTNTDTGIFDNQAITSSSTLSHSWAQGSIAMVDGEGFTLSQAVTGAALGDYVQVSCETDLIDVTVNGYVQSANTVEVRVQNEAAGSRTVSATTWHVKVTKP